MAQITLNSTGVASDGSLVLQSNGTTAAVTIDTSQRASFVAGTAALPAITTTGDTNTGIFFPAADTIAFSEGGTEAMRIDSSGNVGIGTASPTSKLSVSQTGIAVNIGDISSAPSSNVNVFVGPSTSALSGTNGDLVLCPRTSTTGSVLFYTGNGTSAERARIDSSGNVGIGLATTGDTLLEVYGANSATTYKNVNTGTGSSDGFYVGMAKSSGTDGYVYNRESANVIFGTANAERMRIDSSGNLLVGTTGQIGTEKIGVEQTSTTGQAVYCYVANASYAGNVIVVNTARSASTAFTSIATYSAGVNQFYVGGTGLIYSVQLAGGATTLSVNASGQIIRTPSDASLKTNIQPITYGLDTVMKLKPIKHEWVDSIDMGAPSIGFIAQDMELEVPEVVSGEEYKSIDYPKLTAVLTKAIQELKALVDTQASTITQLQADVAALKGTA
jgi:hypothetical protein